MDVPTQFVARADAEKVRQVLINLLSNAIKFTTPGGTISVVAGLRENGNGTDYVELSVVDTGVGIPSEKIDLIFDPLMHPFDTLVVLQPRRM